MEQYQQVVNADEQNASTLSANAKLVSACHKPVVSMRAYHAFVNELT